MRLILIILAILAFTQIKAQNGSVKIVQDHQIESLIFKQILINKNINDINGFKIQIKNTTTQKEANILRQNFSKYFPNLKSYLNYEPPYYKIRIGNYLTKIEAQKDLKKIKRKYYGAYLVPCGVDINEIMK